MKSTTILAIVAIIAAVGAVASAGFAIMATPAHAKCNIHDLPDCDKDDLGHGQSSHDINGDLHSDRKA